MWAVPILLLLLAPILLAWLAVVQSRKGRVTIRPWAWVTGFGLALASFRFAFWACPFSLVSHHLAGDVALAHHLDHLWDEYGWLVMFLWVVGLVLVLALRGVRFRARTFDATANAVAVVCILMLPAVLFDGCAYSGFTAFGGRPPLLVQSVSPDGECRVLAYGWEWLDSATLSLACEDGGPCPILSWPLGEVYPETYGFLGSDCDCRLLWSADSQVVAFQCEGETLIGYDFARRRSLIYDEHNWGFNDRPNTDVYKSVEDLGAALDRLMAEHGGAALRRCPEPSGGTVSPNTSTSA